MKIIFLDIVGVLTNKENDDKLQKRGKKSTLNIDVKSLNLLKELVNVTGANVVISSKLRDGKTPEFKKVINKLKSEGINIYDMTPIYGHKADEIHDYINSRVMLESYVILDDEDITDNIEPELAEHLVLCRSGLNGKDGFTYKHMMKAIKILMGDTYLYTEGGI